MEENESNDMPFKEHYLTLEALKLYNIFDQNKTYALIACELMETVAPEHQKGIYKLLFNRISKFN